ITSSSSGRAHGVPQTSTCHPRRTPRHVSSRTAAYSSTRASAGLTTPRLYPADAPARLRGRHARLVGLDQAVLERMGDGLRAVEHVELAEDVGEVELDRLLGEPQLAADLLVRQAARRALQDLDLLRAQAGCSRGVVRGEPRGRDGL